MNIKTWIKYEENYLPPRCRKLRYRECEEYVNIHLREVAAKNLQLAFEDNSYSGKGKIYFYNNNLWCKAKMPNKSIVEDVKERGHKIESALDWLIYTNANCSAFFFFHWDREERGIDTSRNGAIQAAEDAMNGYILVDGELYEMTSEPRYVVNTFGLGCNHGGTGMFVEYGYNENIRRDNYFSALDGDEAVAYANRIAAGRGDTNDVGKFKKTIIVHMPELVKVNPKMQHGEGNKMLNDMEDIINGTGDALMAGLLCISLIAHNK